MPVAGMGSGHQHKAPSSWTSCLRWVGFLPALPMDNLQHCVGANKKGPSWHEELLLELEIQKKSLPQHVPPRNAASCHPAQCNSL